MDVFNLLNVTKNSLSFWLDSGWSLGVEPCKFGFSRGGIFHITPDFFSLPPRLALLRPRPFSYNEICLESSVQISRNVHRAYHHGLDAIEPLQATVERSYPETGGIDVTVVLSIPHPCIPLPVAVSSALSPSTRKDSER